MTDLPACDLDVSSVCQLVWHKIDKVYPILAKTFWHLFVQNSCLTHYFFERMRRSNDAKKQKTGTPFETAEAFLCLIEPLCLVRKQQVLLSAVLSNIIDAFFFFGAPESKRKPLYPLVSQVSVYRSEPGSFFAS